MDVLDCCFLLSKLFLYLCDLGSMEKLMEVTLEWCIINNLRCVEVIVDLMENFHWKNRVCRDDCAYTGLVCFCSMVA